MRKHGWMVLLAAMAVGGAAVAAKVGDPLYIKAKNTKIFASPAANAAVIATMQPGQQVVWKGAHETKGWHKVAVDGKDGVTMQANLSPNKPATELTASGAEVDAQAFASSGAASKALSEGSVKYAETKGGLEAATVQLITLEQLAAATPERDSRPKPEGKGGGK